MKWYIVRPGWDTAAAVGEFTSADVDTETNKGTIHWQKWSSNRVELMRTAYMLVSQGLPLSTLFNDARIENKNNERVVMIPGPFLLLRAEMPLLCEPILKNVVLAKVVEAPEFSKQELMAVLLARVLAA